MEGLLDELGLLLGEPVLRAEIIGRGHVATVYALYDSQNHTFPVVAKAYPVAGVAQNEMNKLLLLARHSWVRVPAVHSVYQVPQPSLYKEILLLERLPGISVSAPCRRSDHIPALSEHIVDCLLSWHRVDSQGQSG
ncbi:MAG: phosphotransferase, partial [Plesiomonas sp.]